MTALALIAANIQIADTKPRQREALVDMLVHGPLYRKVGRWVSRPDRTPHDHKTVAGLASRGLVTISEGRPDEYWARLTERGNNYARAALAAWVAAADRLATDAELAGLVPAMPAGLSERLARLGEWEKEPAG